MNPRTAWRVPKAHPALRSGEVHVWRSPLDIENLCWRGFYDLLSKDEREQMARFRFDRDRRRYTVTRGVLRTLLGEYTGIRPEAIEFSYGPYGKPELASRQNDRALRFNVSHSGEMALFAVALESNVGVDVEQHRAGVPIMEVARSAFSDREFATLAGLPEVDHEYAFYACWTRKEAYIKAQGTGVSFGLKRFDVTLRPGEPARLMRSEGDPGASRRWALFELNPAQGYAGALAIEGGPWDVHCFDYISLTIVASRVHRAWGDSPGGHEAFVSGV